MGNVEPAIYVADLAAYNSGILHGKWIKLEGKDADEVNAEIEAMLAEGTLRFGLETLSSKHEEFAIHDYEGFGPIQIREYESIDSVMAHVERMGDEPAKYFAFIDAVGLDAADEYDPSEAMGPYSGDEAYAWEMLDSAIGTDDLATYLEKLGVPFASFFKFDAADFVFSEKCNGTAFGEYERETYVFLR